MINLNKNLSIVSTKTNQYIYQISDGVGATRTGNDIQFRINQTSSFLKTTIKDLYNLTLKNGFKPVARVSSICLLWNNASNDTRFYIGTININPTGKISISRQEWEGGMTVIKDGGTYYVWSLNMTYRTNDDFPAD